MTTSNAASPGWTLALAGIASFTVALDALVTAAALTSIQHDFQASLADLQWITNAYNLSFAVLLSVGAAVGDRWGRKRVFIAGIILFAVASVACALSSNVPMLIASRALQGAGAALVTPVALAMLGVAFPAERRARALGIFGGITGLAPLGGPVLGGTIAQTFHWSGIFWINIPIAVIVVSLAAMKLTESRGAPARLDALGILMIAAASLAATWALMHATEVGWRDPWIVAALIATVVLTLGLILWERRAANALLPPRLFQAPGFTGALVSTFCMYGGLYSTLFFVTQFEQVGQGYGSMLAGLRILPWTATLFIVAPLAGSLINRLGECTLSVSGLFLNVVGLVWLWVVTAPEASFIAMAPALMTMGVGLSLAMPAVQSAVMRMAGVADIGKASGAFSISRFLGGAFGIAISASVFAAAGSFAGPQKFTDGFRAALLTLAAAVLLGAVAATRLPKRADTARAT